jgi:hypothetical protein
VGQLTSSLFLQFRKTGFLLAQPKQEPCDCCQGHDENTSAGPNTCLGGEGESLLLCLRGLR